MSDNYNYEEIIMPITGDPAWKVQDISLAVGGVEELMQEFIDKYNHPDFTLSVFDNLTKRTLRIKCDVSEIPAAVSYIYHLEKATPLMFIEREKLSGCYIVGMSLTQGNIEFGCYEFKDGKLVKGEMF